MSKIEMVNILKKGDFIKLDYTGRIKENNLLFDTTVEKIAKKENAFNPKVTYEPASIIVGAKKIIKGVDEALLEMKVGEKRKIEIAPKKAFGERNLKLIKIIPQHEFKKRNITPFPGMQISLDNIMGRVLSVNSGRVKIDFNNPLAGKYVIYELEIKKLIKDPKEKIRSICKYYGVNCSDVLLKTDEIELIVDKNIQRKKKEMITMDAKEYLNIKKLKFSEIFTNER